MSHQPRILHVSSPLSWRGGEQQIAYLMKEMRTQNRSFGLLCPQASIMHHRIQMDSDAVQYANFSLHAFKKRGGTDPVLACQLARLSKNYDILHAHDSQAHTAAVMANAFFGARTPVVLSRRVDFPVADSPISAWKYNHPSIKRILCVSDFIAEMVRSAVKNPERVSTVHSGIDPAKYHIPPPEKKGTLHQMLSLPSHFKLIGNVSALADHKDYFTFLNTIKLLCDERKDIHAVVIGTGPLEEEIKAHAGKLELNQNVSFLGFRDDLNELLPCLDILLFTSKTEGLGTSILDAMSCGVTVVASRTGGIPEIVKENQNGLLAEVGNAQDFKATCLRLLNDQGYKKQLTTNALNGAADFHYQKMAQKTMAVYDELL